MAAKLGIPRQEYQVSDTKKNVFVGKDIARGIIPEYLQALSEVRQAAKRKIKAAAAASDEMGVKIANAASLAAKTAMNSMYGCTGAPFGPLSCRPVAETTTYLGRQLITITAEIVEKIVDQLTGGQVRVSIVYGDTDSVMVCFFGLSVQEAWSLGENVCDKVSAFLSGQTGRRWRRVFSTFAEEKRVHNPDLESKIDEGRNFTYDEVVDFDLPHLDPSSWVRGASGHTYIPEIGVMNLVPENVKHPSLYTTTKKKYDAILYEPGVGGVLTKLPKIQAKGSGKRDQTTFVRRLHKDALYTLLSECCLSSDPLIASAKVCIDSFDLCVKSIAAGLQRLVDNDVALEHHVLSKRIKAEASYLQNKNYPHVQVAMKMVQSGKKWPTNARIRFFYRAPENDAEAKRMKLCELAEDPDATLSTCKKPDRNKACVDTMAACMRSLLGVFSKEDVKRVQGVFSHAMSTMKREKTGQLSLTQIFGDGDETVMEFAYKHTSATQKLKEMGSSSSVKHEPVRMMAGDDPLRPQEVGSKSPKYSGSTSHLEPPAHHADGVKRAVGKSGNTEELTRKKTKL